MSAALDLDRALIGISRSLYYQRAGILVDGERFDLRAYPYLTEIYDDDHPDQVIRKGSQLGLTTTIVLRGIDRCIHEYTRGLAYYFPTEADVSAFSRARFRRLVEENDCLAHAVRRDDADSVGLRRIGDCYVYFRGANSPSGAKSIPCDELVLDELDEMSPDQVEQIEHRLDAADPEHARRKTELSTPTLPEYGVDAHYLASDQMRWVLVCRGCRSENILEDQFLADPEATLREDAHGVARVWCRHCREPLVRKHEDPDGVTAFWRALRPEVTARRGRWISQLHAPRLPLQVILDDYRAKCAAGRIRDFYNHRLGASYAEWDDALTDEMILSACTPSQPILSSSQGPCAAGVDVGADDLHVIVGERRAQDLSQVIYYDRLRSFDELAQVRARYNVACMVIDSMAETRAVRDFVRSNPGAWGCWYSDERRGDYDWDEIGRRVTVGRTEALDAAHHRLSLRMTRLPAVSERLREQLVPQLKNLARIREEEERSGVKTGRIKTRWVVRGAVKNDHYRHALTYYEIALGRVPIIERSTTHAAARRAPATASGYRVGYTRR